MTALIGLIPACAGKTTDAATITLAAPAHPRVCGENIYGPGVWPMPVGSSPRVRGKPTHYDAGRLGGRLIPACAGKTAPRSRADPRRRAHPRVCGENRRQSADESAPAGSSPRVRGKPARRLSDMRRARLIPACAGKTLPHRCPTDRREAHPRVCGENDQAGKIVALRPGSSPRVRGKRKSCGSCRDETGLIPACAGKTSTQRTLRMRPEAHPRVCGENLEQSIGAVDTVGSSPRVRGKLAAPFEGGGEIRLIPACAGKTAQVANQDIANRAHPRVCGENSQRSHLSERRRGSSPRVRGKLIAFQKKDSYQGLIPACAGKTDTASARRHALWAHPRVCGENRAAWWWKRTSWGSSPRVRGKLFPPRLGFLRLRLIPACAGKTISAQAGALPVGAHPRVCGENYAHAGEVMPYVGSSPRVRGKLAWLAQPLRRLGLIPACAGKTRSRRPRSLSRGAHPRVCGENTHPQRMGRCAWGSSPRVRGKHRRLD